MCPVCFWEDDGIDIDQLDEHSDPNHITLRQGRSNFQKYGACDSTVVKNMISRSKRKNFRFEQRILK
ncbi:MAG: CPCC family cysteine-rich protein [Bacteroidota bacterium]